MSSMEEVEAAEARMDAAKNELLRYIESQKTIHRERYQQLVARVKKSQAEFLQAISRLGE